MDQTGNKPKLTLKGLADMKRAQECAEAEAIKLGQPASSVRAQIFQEPKHVEQIKTEMPIPLLTMEEALLNSAEGAKFLGYTKKSFRNAVAAGKIPHYKLLGQNRFKKSELLGLLIRVEPNKS